MRTFMYLGFLVGALSLLGSCAGGVAGNDGGSEPLNDVEALDYKRAINRCYKSGGTRVVKIKGRLRCYD